MGAIFLLRSLPKLRPGAAFPLIWDPRLARLCRPGWMSPRWNQAPSRASSLRSITSATSSATIDGALVGRFRQPLVQAGNHTFPLLRTYGDAQPGDYLALVNSFGVLEIARAEQSAAEGLGLSRGAPIVVRKGLVAIRVAQGPQSVIVPSLAALAGDALVIDKPTNLATEQCRNETTRASISTMNS